MPGGERKSTLASVSPLSADWNPTVTSNEGVLLQGYLVDIMFHVFFAWPDDGPIDDQNLTAGLPWSYI